MATVPKKPSSSLAEWLKQLDAFTGVAGVGALAMGVPDESEAANPLRWRPTPGAWRPQPGEARLPQLPPPATTYEPLNTAGLMGGYERQMGEALREPRRGILSEQSAVEMADESLDPKLNAGLGLLSATRARDFAQMEHQPQRAPMFEPPDIAANIYNTGAGVLGTGLGMAVDAGKMLADFERFTSGHSDPLEQLRGPRLAGEEYSEEPVGGVDWFTRQLGGDPESMAALAGSLATPIPVGTVGKAQKAGSLAERATEAGMSKFKTTTPARIVNKTAERGGYSVHLPTGEVPTSGAMVGRYRNDDKRNMVLTEPLRREHTVQHAETNKGVLSEADKYYGTWKAGEKTYLDVSKRFPTSENMVRLATKYGERTDQETIFDIDADTLRPVGNWKKFVASPEYEQRINDMAAVGRQYMDRHGGGDWWGMKGGPWERVYGRDKLDQAIGFISSTSSNTEPRENAQLASEYLRRLIKGEPIIQPEWRVPEGTMSRKAGTEIGLEEPRTPNLLASARGDLGALSGPVIRQKAQAMSDQRGTSVVDRWHVRGTEDPERGIFAAGREDVLSPKQHAIVQKRLQDIAARAGKDAATISSESWVGMRETAKSGALFTQPQKAGSVKGESYSYNQHLEQLLDDKSKFLGITKDELEKRLSAGDENLLSLLLATPVGWALFEQSRQGEAGALREDPLGT